MNVIGTGRIPQRIVNDVRGEAWPVARRMGVPEGCGLLCRPKLVVIPSDKGDIDIAQPEEESEGVSMEEQFRLLSGGDDRRFPLSRPDPFEINPFEAEARSAASAVHMKNAGQGGSHLKKGRFLQGLSGLAAILNALCCGVAAKKSKPPASVISTANKGLNGALTERERDFVRRLEILQVEGGLQNSIKSCNTNPMNAVRLPLPHSIELDMYQAEVVAQLQGVKLKEDRKFKFDYRSNNLKGKFLEEDDFALNVIQSEASRRAVSKVVDRFLGVIENGNDPSDDQARFVEVLNAEIGGRRGSYPVLNKDFKNFPDLLNFLKTPIDAKNPNHHVRLLSILWLMPKGMKIEVEDLEIDAIYAKMLHPTKDYLTVAEKGTPLVSSAFGNGGGVKFPIFADTAFHPYSRDVEYRAINPDSTSATVQSFIVKKIPYVSGLSGMANMTCKLLHKLAIDPTENDVGKPFCEAMASFIVGSGMHSYSEVYKAFNLYVKLQQLKLRQQKTAP